MIGRTNAKGLSEQSWANYIAVRNRTKTTIEAGDIDVSNLTGASSASYLFNACTALTSAILNFSAILGAGCLVYCFQGCTSLLYLRINLKSITNIANSFTAILSGATSLNTLVIDEISDVAIFNSTSPNSNIFAQATLSTCQNLSFNSAIKPNLYLAVMTSLNLASVVQVLGQLHDYSGVTAHTITFNRAFIGLSQGDYDTIAAAVTTANARNWTVAGLTYSM